VNDSIAVLAEIPPQVNHLANLLSQRITCLPSWRFFMGQNGIDNDLLKVGLWNFVKDNAGVLLGRSAREWVIAGFASSARMAP
jgi:hypothetical protein